MRKITYDDTRDISIRCVNKMRDMNILSENEYHHEIQDLIQDEINKVLKLDIDDYFEVIINN